MAQNLYQRTAKLLADQIKKTGVPMVFVGLLGMIAQFCDSLIAARCLSLQTFSAISLVTPLTFFESFVVADILVGGVYFTMLRIKGEGKDEDADYAAGTFTLNAFFWCTLLLVLFAVFGRRIIAFFTTDTVLAEEAFKYCLPGFIGLPLQCAFLCTERELKCDGRLFFFSIRGIIACTLNVVFDLVAVYLLHMGIEGLSWATVASTLVSYGLSFSHLFSRHCTVFPKFSFSKWKLAFPYLKKSLKMGAMLAVEDIFINITSAVINKCICMTTNPNSAYLSYYAVFTTITSVFAAVRSAIETILSQFETVCHLEEDDEGLRKNVVFGAEVLCICAGVVVLFCFLFPDLLAVLFGIPLATEGAEFAFCIRACSVSLIGAGIISLFGSLCYVVDQKKRYLRLAVSQNLATCASVFCAAKLAGIHGVWVLYSVIPTLFTIVTLFLFPKTLPNKDTKKIENIVSYSAVISANASTDISTQVQQLLEPILSPNMALKVALLVEEMLMIIKNVNAARGKTNVIADIRVVRNREHIIVMVYDNGYPFNMSKQAEKHEYSLNRYLVETITDSIEAYRISELNVNKCILLDK